MKRRILVTGGAGFIGSHVVDHHIALGDDIVVIDDLTTGRRHNLAHHPAHRLELIEARVEDPGVMQRALDGGIDRIYHLAAVVGVFEVLRRPLDALRSNLDATEAVFEIAATHGIRTIFASTSEVYGKNDADRLDELQDAIYGPTSVTRWLYAASKATDEFMALAYRAEFGLPVTVVRLFNTTGPRQSGSYGMVVPRLVRQALHGEALTVFGDGTQTRCFTNVFDVVAAMTALADTDESIGEVVNIGQPEEISIADLARRVIELTHSRSALVFIPYEQAYGAGFEDMRRRVPDVTKLRRLVGDVPFTLIDDTIGQVIEAVLAEERTTSGAH